MTDDLSTYGLGALPDPPDERDYPLSALYAAEGLTASVVLPATYAAPGMPPVLDQHATPMCVAYSSSGGEGVAGPARPGSASSTSTSRPSSPRSAALDGARVRDAMERMRTAGYPVVGVGDPAHHRIAAY